MKKLLENKYIESFFLAAMCATVFTMSLCYWILELTYKYNHNTDSFVDINWVAGAGLILSAYFLIRKKRIDMDPAILFLLQVAVLIAIVDYNNGEFIKVCYAWFVPIAYICGKLAITYDDKIISNTIDIEKDKRAVEKRTLLIVAALVIGMFLISFSDFWPNWKSGWAFGTENWSSAWAENTTARTTFGLGFVPTISICFIIFFIYKKHIFLSLVILVSNIVVQYISYKTEGRTFMMMLPLAGMVMGCMALYDNWKTIDKRKKTLIILVPCLLIVFGIIAFYANAFGIHDRYDNSFMSAGGGFLRNERIRLNVNAIKNIIAYPTDNIHTRYGLHTGHNISITFGAAYDVTIMILVVLVRLFYTIEAFKMAFNKNIGFIKYILIPIFVNLNIYYSLEPNAAWAREYWMAGLLISGMIAGWNSKGSIRKG